MTDRIPILDLRAQTRALETEIMAAFHNVLAESAFIKGPEVRLLQSEFAAFLGGGGALGVANGTDALVLALRALGVGPGDEVVTTPFSFIATAECISLVGAKPVFADIDPATFNLDPERAAERITPRTRAIIGVHLYGNPCDASALQALAAGRGLAFVEDCAQAVGALHDGRRVGSIGTFGCFSFFPSKNLGAFGDAGMVATPSEAHLQTVAALADHGSRVRYHHDLVGMNSRLDTLQAAVLRVKLRHLEAWNERRRAIAARYSRNLADSGIVPPADAPRGRHVYHQYTVRVPAHRDALHQQLNASGVTAVIYYPVSLHLQPVYRGLGHRVGDFPHAERAQDEVLSLPMFPELTDEQVDVICGRLLASYRALSRGNGAAAAAPPVALG